MDFIIDHEMIKKEMEKFNYVPEPEKEVGFEDKIVDEIKDKKIRDIYSLAMLWKGAAIEMLETVNNDEGVYIGGIISTVSDASILMSIFYNSLRRHFSLWEEEIDIRKGWKVVIPK